MCILYIYVCLCVYLCVPPELSSLSSVYAKSMSLAYIFHLQMEYENYQYHLH